MNLNADPGGMQDPHVLTGGDADSIASTQPLHANGALMQRLHRSARPGALEGHSSQDLHADSGGPTPGQESNDPGRWPGSCAR